MDELEPTTAEEREKWRLLLAATPERDFQHEALPDLERQAPLSVREAKRLVADVERLSAPRQGEPKPIAWMVRPTLEEGGSPRFVTREHAVEREKRDILNSGYNPEVIPLYAGAPGPEASNYHENELPENPDDDKRP